MSSSRSLLARLRELMAAGRADWPKGGVVGEAARSQAGLRDLAALIAGEMGSEVCAIYTMRPGDTLELTAAQGLNQDAVGRTRLRVGEGIVGIAAATATVQNLPDAQSHPSFAYRPETGEDPFASLLALPLRRAGRTLGVLTVQNRLPRRYTEDEIDGLETVAMLLAEQLAASGVTDVADGLGSVLPRQFAATPLAPGLAMGPVVLHGRGAPVRRMLADDTQAEVARITAAASSIQLALDTLIDKSRADGDGAREVLEATRLVSADDGWLRRVREAAASGLSAEAAIQRVSHEVRERMRRIQDPYLRERLADLEEMADRMLAALDGGEPPVAIPTGAILLARRLGPAQLLEWHARGIGGVVIEEGSLASHAAILARALGLPALGGATGTLEAVESGDGAILDADEGQLILRPGPEVQASYRHAMQVRQEIEAGYAAQRARPAHSKDGVRLLLQLNVGLAREMDQLENTGADGIGLFRTEIAMLARGELTDVPEQAALYSRVLDAAGDRPVRFRTLDLGGDKMLKGAPPQVEENPAMGWRSLRIGLDRPVMLRRQLRALLLAAGGRPLSVMFPMVATVAEFRAAKSLLFTEAARVRPAPSQINVGSMLEVPALLFQLPALMAEADFVSIGSNDLLQFFFAADRGTPALANRYDLLSAPVLDALERIVEAAQQAGVEVSVCGEHASRPLEAMVLAAVGITTLSMPAPSLLRLKAVLANVDLRALREVLTALRRTQTGPASLREPIDSWAREHGLRF
ncbi:MAG: putative PEP-binding protein [Acetobacteraceae bacterium]|nr:putative PEP-binding protein [Acetobacteraceae bacterium]